MSEPMQVTDEMREREKLFAAAMRKIQEGVTPVIITEVIHERVRQEVCWGEQNHAVVGNRGAAAYGLDAHLLRKACDQAVIDGNVTWADILVEEVAEALEGETEDEQRIELIHVAAVAVATIEAIDRRRLKARLEAMTEEQREAAGKDEPEAYEEFTVVARGRTEKRFDVVRPMTIVDVEAWEEQVRGEVLAYLESVGVTDVEAFTIEPKPVPTFEPGDAVEFWHGGPGDLDVLLVIRQEGGTVFAFSTFLKKVTDFDARRLTPARDQILDMMVNDTTTGDVMSYRDMIERARL
jgi:hypothetical protein